ncbi:asparagine synthase (glutamine-hydrolyzing) [Paramagnetospirillum kuznetsovii]|uniref:asparagine synthase (glutamine-hydrolyzing) n=1 Tax=Paramagnetospirillum kuznetsovii TaxID=2053833 RepID=A0A364NXY9_9PROT|nr:asparagine synthase (glutamine-hydrolyzing) [Paramagnetospirillum kuznetsovii]RAU21860.1 asparagine synthase (glutamine-hydrolyzing) [Paramagnetospirillum kuznetsovii]
MCGIWASVAIEVGRSVINAVAHRGPDGEGWETHVTPSGTLALGHRRLAIIDSSAGGDQPMASANSSHVIVYNGEIYNHVELRVELEAKGHRFRSRSDTEVLLAAWSEWGEACLDRFNGMFAFVLWDKGHNRLFAARDRFGVKPLYVWSPPSGGVAFASEIKQFAAVNGFRASLEIGAAYDFLAWGVFDHSAQTLFKGVRQLRGGECAVVRLDCGPPEPVVRRWYSMPSAGSLRLSAAEAVDRFRVLMDDSVRLRLRSDVPVGACLSGGLDSSAIVCLAARQMSRPMVTVSACYADNRIDERPFMDEVNAAISSRPVQIFPDGRELPDLLERLVHHQDGPFGSTSVFAQWQVFEAARRTGVPVMLDGQGADEQLAGYHPAFTAHHAGLLRRGRLTTLVAELAAQRRRHGTSVYWQAAVLARALLPEGGRQILRRIRGIGRPSWLEAEFCGGHHVPLPATATLERLIESQMLETSLPMLLHYEDRNSMAHGVESRLPFLDYRLVELVVGLGAQHKIVGGETKWLLRRAMEPVLPTAITHRQDKIGFATPEKNWLAGPARAMVDQFLEEAIQRFPGVFVSQPLRRYANDVLGGGKTFDFTLWRILSFAAWGRVFGVQA